MPTENEKTPPKPSEISLGKSIKVYHQKTNSQIMTLSKTSIMFNDLKYTKSIKHKKIGKHK